MDTDQDKENEGAVPLLCAADMGGYVLPERCEDFEEMFPDRVYINLGVREDRRQETEYQFQTQGFQVQRFPAVRGWKARKKRGHGSGNKYACRLSHRLILRRAWLEGLDCVMIFEDDLVLAANFRELIERFPPPDDWGVLFIGCTHVQPPELAAPMWARLNDVWGMQAYVVRKKYYKTILSRLWRKEGAGALGTDVAYSSLSKKIPMYAAYPNLAWQRPGFSDLEHRVRMRYDEEGRQKIHGDKLLGVDVGMRKLLLNTGRVVKPYEGRGERE